MKILLIDNYDSFVYNLYHAIAGIDDTSVTVLRNDDDTLLTRVASKEFDAVIIGPGPGSPDDQNYFGQCLKILQIYGNKGLPIFGVCLGFQGIAYAFGATLRRASRPTHGKLSSLVIHRPSRIFTDIPDNSIVMRYHSLMIDMNQQLPEVLRITAEVDSSEQSVAINGREIMAIEHTTLPIYGVQFHPESYASDKGRQMVRNFIEVAKNSDYCRGGHKEVINE